jgi:AraC-like DNA-binding protein
VAESAIVISLELCTAGLGLFLAAPLLAMARRRPANVWLAAFVASFASLALADFCFNTGIYRQYPAIAGLFDVPLACLGASFYCYTRSMTGLGVGWRQAWHLLPLPFWIAVLLVMRDGGAPRWLFPGAVLTLQLLTLAYGVAVLWRLRAYHRAVRQNYSSMRRRDLHWLSWLSGVLMVLLLAWLPATMLGGVWGMLLVAGRLAVLCFAGWFGMRHAAVFLPATPALGAAPPAPAAEARYARSGMTDAAADEIGQRLQRRAAQQRDFLEPDLTLSELSQRLGTSAQLLSQYLNEVLGVSFYDYVNGLRVAEVQRLMREPAQRDASLLDLSLAAGFNSRSTFNAAFKKVTGLPPSQWRRQAGAVSEPIGQDDRQPA